MKILHSKRFYGVFLFEYKYVVNINFRKFSNIRKYGPMKKIMDHKNQNNFSNYKKC